VDQAIERVWAEISSEHDEARHPYYCMTIETN
jgi:hypothetical protein